MQRPDTRPPSASIPYRPGGQALVFRALASTQDLCGAPQSDQQSSGPAHVTLSDTAALRKDSVRWTAVPTVVVSEGGPGVGDRDQGPPAHTVMAQFLGSHKTRVVRVVRGGHGDPRPFLGTRPDGYPKMSVPA